MLWHFYTNWWIGICKLLVEGCVWHNTIHKCIFFSTGNCLQPIRCLPSFFSQSHEPTATAGSRVANLATSSLDLANFQTGDKTRQLFPIFGRMLTLRPRHFCGKVMWKHAPLLFMSLTSIVKPSPVSKHCANQSLYSSAAVPQPRQIQQHSRAAKWITHVQSNPFVFWLATDNSLSEKKRICESTGIRGVSKVSHTNTRCGACKQESVVYLVYKYHSIHTCF